MAIAPRDKVQGKGTVKAVNGDSFDLLRDNGSELHVLFSQCAFSPEHVKGLLEPQSSEA